MDKFTPVLKLEHSDSRGEIYSIALPGNKELMLLHSKAGTLRGGHAHDVDETVILLTGKMNYYKKKSGDLEYVETIKEGVVQFNPRGLYHMGEFTEDSWVLEWKIGTSKNQWKNLDFLPWRKKVQDNVAATTSTV